MACAGRAGGPCSSHAVGRRLPHGVPDAWAQLPSLHYLRRRQCPEARRRLAFRTRSSAGCPPLSASQSVMGKAWPSPSPRLRLPASRHRRRRRAEALISPPRGRLFTDAALPITLYDPNIYSPVILLFLENNTRSSSCAWSQRAPPQSELSTSSRLANAACGSAVARRMAQLNSCCLAKGQQRHCG